jgi:hypothetical protein
MKSLHGRSERRPYEDRLANKVMKSLHGRSERRPYEDRLANKVMKSLHGHSERRPYGARQRCVGMVHDRRAGEPDLKSPEGVSAYEFLTELSRPRRIRSRSR